MENHYVTHIRNWVCLLAIFAVFSIPFSHANDLIGGTMNSSSSIGVDSVTFQFNCIDGAPGDTICIPVTVENFNNINIIQFEIFWNSSVLDYIEVSNPGTTSINVVADFNLSGPNALKFIPLGFPIDGESLPDGTVLFEICFRIIGFPDSTSCVGISPFFEFEVGDVNGQVPADSINCCMMVEDAVDLVGFITSCGPSMAGGNGAIDVNVYGGTAPYTITGVPGGPFNIPTEGGSLVINAPTGSYTITITDALGSNVNYTTEVSTIELTVTTRPKDPTCYKFKNGTIWIKPQGGTEPYSYIWQSMSNASLAGSGFIRNLGDSSLVTSLPDGLYNILVRDNNGCETSVTVTLNDNPFVILVEDLINASCVGAENGLIDLTITGATPDVSGNYLIRGNLTGTPFTITSNMVSIGLLDPGNYSITISDEVSQCDTVFNFTIGYSDTISANISVTDPPCAGGVNGSLSIHGLTNGVPGPSYTYTIYDHGAPVTTQCCIGGTFNYSPLAPGDYVAIVEEGSCTSDSIHFTIGEPQAMIVNVVGSVPDNCIPTASGDIWFEILNSSGSYTLEAGAGFQDADTLFNLNAGNYTLTVTDDVTGCTVTQAFSIQDGDDNEEIDVSFVIDGTPCEGGTVTVLYQGGPIPPGAGVLWSTGEVNDTILITETDTLSVDVILGAPIFCILDDTVHIECERILDLDITVQHPLCGEGAEGGPYTGTVIVDTANAVAPVTWIWSVPDTTTSGIYTGLTPGKYYVTVTDGLDSVAVDSFEIIAPPTLGLAFNNIDSTSCHDICDGTATIVAANGDPTLDYQLYWDPINPMADTGIIFNVNSLCPGMNIFIVTQDGICFYKDSVEILAPDSITIDLIQAVDASCHGDSDGIIEVAASGGTPGYVYDWANGPTTALNNGISAGWYYVTITDSNTCSTSDSFSISEPDTLIADIDSAGTLNLSCGGNSDGIISLNVSGGNGGNYTYTWDPDVSTTYQAVNLGVGLYSITVTDPKGCQDTTSYLLTAPPPIAVEWPVVVDPACFGDETLLLIENVTGGSGNYSFNINSGALFDIGEPVMLTSGIYVVTVFDDRGCSTDTTYIIMEPDPIIVSISPENPVIDLGDSILLTGIVEQSQHPIAMSLWTSSEPLSCPTCEETWVFNVVPATYTWTVIDTNGCEGSSNILVDVDYERDVYIPNVFSPNNDGRNDEFKIFTGPGVVSINFINIYDRWGNLLHVEGQQMPSESGAGHWDGTAKGGELVGPGVYVYVVEITFVDNNTTLTYSGDVTLLK
jgi:gliding motility-associated-like protein